MAGDRWNVRPLTDANSNFGRGEQHAFHPTGQTRKTLIDGGHAGASVSVVGVVSGIFDRFADLV